MDVKLWKIERKYGNLDEKLRDMVNERFHKFEVLASSLSPFS
jgi:hypothetical protein